MIAIPTTACSRSQWRRTEPGCPIAPAGGQVRTTAPGRGFVPRCQGSQPVDLLAEVAQGPKLILEFVVDGHVVSRRHRFPAELAELDGEA